MEGVLTEIIDPNIVLVTITSQAAYLTAKPEDKEDTEMQDIPVNKIKLAKSTVNSICRSYDDHTREEFINRMIEDPVKKGRVATIARNLGAKPSTAARRPSNFTGEHEQHIQEIVEKDLQLCAVDIIDSLTSKFEGFSISKSQMNHHLKNNVFISVKNPTFEPKIKNSDKNLQKRYEWFMEWKDSDLEYVEVESSDDREANKPPSKGITTARFIKFMNEMLDIMDIHGYG
ncbi:unnamed protein product [Rhizopus stolonifer]